MRINRLGARPHPAHETVPSWCQLEFSVEVIFAHRKIPFGINLDASMSVFKTGQINENTRDLAAHPWLRH